MAKKKNAFYAQSGGVTAVINASACGVIETARKHSDVIGKVYDVSVGGVIFPSNRPPFSPMRQAITSQFPRFVSGIG